MKKILVLAFFGLLLSVTVQSGNIGTYQPDVGIEQALILNQPVTDFMVANYEVCNMVSLPTAAPVVLMPIERSKVYQTLKQDAWRNPDWGGSLALKCTTNQPKLIDANSVFKIPLQGYSCNWQKRTTHNFNTDFSYGLRFWIFS